VCGFNNLDVYSQVEKFPGTATPTAQQQSTDSLTWSCYIPGPNSSW